MLADSALAATLVSFLDMHPYWWRLLTKYQRLPGNSTPVTSSALASTSPPLPVLLLECNWGHQQAWEGTHIVAGRGMTTYAAIGGGGAWAATYFGVEPVTAPIVQVGLLVAVST